MISAPLTEPSPIASDSGKFGFTPTRIFETPEPSSVADGVTVSVSSFSVFPLFSNVTPVTCGKIVSIFTVIVRKSELFPASSVPFNIAL